MEYSIVLMDQKLYLSHLSMMIIVTVMMVRMSQVITTILFIRWLGTNSCSNGRFFCLNIGGNSSFIHSSRVNDGVCELECCDGTDEISGYCTNSCLNNSLFHRVPIIEGSILKPLAEQVIEESMLKPIPEQHSWVHQCLILFFFLAVYSRPRFVMKIMTILIPSRLNKKVK